MASAAIPLGDQTFVESKRKTQALLVGSLAAAGVGVWMILTGRIFGWIVVAFCGFGGVVIARSLTRPALLELTPLTITFRYAISGRSLRYELCRCGEFRPWRRFLNRGSLVVFDYDGPLPTFDRAPMGRTTRPLGARRGNVPSIFGMNCRALADLLNEYRAHAQSCD